MLFAILSLVLLVVGIVFLVINWKCFARLYPYDDQPFLFVGGIIGCIIGGILTVICLISIPAINCPYNEAQVRTKYETIVEELKSDYTYIQNISDDYARSVAAVQYNERVKTFKTDIKSKQIILNNIWFNWFECYEYSKFDPNIVDYIK